MARIRTIKPEFFTSDDVVALTPWARLLYIALWCEADREGRLQWKPGTFKRRYFPDDQVDIDALCNELVQRRLVVLYGDSALGYIPTFRDHQHINPRETASSLPDPQSWVDPPRVTTRHDASNLDLHTQGGREGKEGKGTKEAQSADPAGSSPPEPDGLDIPAPLAPPDDSSAGRPRAEDVDPVKAIFDLGIPILTAAGHTERAARSLIGRLRKLKGDEQAASVLVAAKSKTDPATYIAAATLPEKRRVQLC